MWSDAGVANRHIMAISGHRCEQSLSHYNTRPSTAQLHHCSDVLSRRLEQSSSSTGAIVSQPSLQLPQLPPVAAAVQQNNLLLHDVQGSAPQNIGIGSLFNNCSFEKFEFVLSSARCFELVFDKVVILRIDRFQIQLHNYSEM
ncbi:hypothetical protein AC249_AIPGENE384 [Exaiptasia diaphana]|nr:hypothetical protein AC249_AIPGENE384 [Exaiptasia diaphana]